MCNQRETPRAASYQPPPGWQEFRTAALASYHQDMQHIRSLAESLQAGTCNPQKLLELQRATRQLEENFGSLLFASN